jgi:hypothetical protein
VQLVVTLRASDRRLNSEDKKELKKEVAESDKKNEKKLEDFFKFRHISYAIQSSL